MCVLYKNNFDNNAIVCCCLASVPHASCNTIDRDDKGIQQNLLHLWPGITHSPQNLHLRCIRNSAVIAKDGWIAG